MTKIKGERKAKNVHSYTEEIDVSKLTVRQLAKYRWWRAKRNQRERSSSWKQGPKIEVNPVTPRRCRLCLRQLRAYRYFTCEKHVKPEYLDLEVDYDYSELRRL